MQTKSYLPFLPSSTSSFAFTTLKLTFPGSSSRYASDAAREISVPSIVLEGESSAARLARKVPDPEAISVTWRGFVRAERRDAMVGWRV